MRWHSDLGRRASENREGRYYLPNRKKGLALDSWNGCGEQWFGQARLVPFRGRRADWFGRSLYRFLDFPTHAEGKSTSAV
jgi:hypothetical protein